MELSDKAELKSFVITNPDTRTIAQKTRDEGKIGHNSSIQCQFAKHFLRCRILTITGLDRLYPVRHQRRSRHALCWRRGMARERISGAVGGARTINNTVLETKELGKNPLLPMGV
jgi:hypothetical protein